MVVSKLCDFGRGVIAFGKSRMNRILFKDLWMAIVCSFTVGYGVIMLDIPLSGALGEGRFDLISHLRLILYLFIVQLWLN